MARRYISQKEIEVNGFMKRTHRSTFIITVALAGFIAVQFTGCSSSNPTLTPIIPADPSIVALYGDNPLTLDEFEKRYARTVGGAMIAAADSVSEYEEFLDRYIDFRLKVMYAAELGLDQDSSILAEIESYRNQLARPYLLEREILDPILRDLYEKQQFMIDASHILARAGESATPEDTLRAYNKMLAIQDSLEQGMDFGDLAFRNSEDPSARSNGQGAKGRLGFFAGGRMVKAFEDKAYSTPVGESSPIFRTQFGYHILYVHDRQPRIPDVWGSHIAIRPSLRTPNDTVPPEDRIQQIYERLEQGEDFADLARETSQDMETGPRGGQFGRVSYIRPGIPENFREALFSLQNPGDYSEIIQTEYGLHIIRLDQREVLKSFEDSYEELKAQASRLPRVKAAERSRAKQIREKYGVEVDTTRILETLGNRHFKVADILETPAAEMDAIVASIGDATFTFRDIVDFAETAAVPYSPDTLAMTYTTLDLFLDDEALNFEAGRLEDNDDEFRYIMEEFQDGLLLFKLMEDSVWTAAASDTAGLMAYHQPRADSFWFPDRVRVISFRNRSDSLMEAVKIHVSNGETIGDIAAGFEADTTISVRIDTTYISEPNNSIFDRALELETGQVTDPILNAGSYIVLVNDGVEKARQKTFAEARSEVLNAYQQIVEERLLDRLRQKYGARAFHDRLAPAFAEEKLELKNNPGVPEITVDQ